MDNQQEFMPIAKAKDLVKHTDKMTSDKRFPKKYRFTLVNRMQNRALDIYECITEANELDLKDRAEKAERLRLQRRALTLCKTLLFLIEFCYEKESIQISSSQCGIWTRHVMDVKNLTAKWHKTDKTRS